jgi:CheY-like chemotaxis protein
VPCAHQIATQILAGTDKVAQPLKLWGRDGDRTQLSGGVQPGQLQGVTRVSLDAVSGLTRGGPLGQPRRPAPDHPRTEATVTHTILIATSDTAGREQLAAQLDVDGHTVHCADSAEATIAKLAAHAVDVLVLAELERPADSPALLRAIRAGRHPRVHPAQVVVTLGAADEPPGGAHRVRLAARGPGRARAARQQPP